jgi:excisionase family DNA binding protein
MSRRPAVAPTPRSFDVLRAMTIADFCERYSLSRPTAYRLIRTGQLSDVTIGKRRLILVEDAERLIRPAA